jgi:hypothetical protein
VCEQWEGPGQGTGRGKDIGLLTDHLQWERIEATGAVTRSCWTATFLCFTTVPHRGCVPSLGWLHWDQSDLKLSKKALATRCCLLPYQAGKA